MLTLDLAGKVALVTGASSGLGWHFATLLASNGARVALTGRRHERLRTLADQIAAGGGIAYPCVLDVTDEASVAAGCRAAEAALGPIDLLVNNAGVAGPSRRALEVSGSEFGAVLATDLTGAFQVARNVAVRLVELKRPGNIVNIASILGVRVTVGVAAYEAAKAGLLHLTKALALEWARHGIRVNALAPGYIETDINREFFASAPGQALVQRVPMRRLGQLADLDGPFLLLASEASRYMTGAVVTVDGGHLVSGL